MDLFSYLLGKKSSGGGSGNINMLIESVSAPDTTIGSNSEISYDIEFTTPFEKAPRIVLVTFENDRFTYQVQDITKDGCKLWVRNVTSTNNVHLVGFTYLAIK